jgi:hypothetical protein
MLERTMEPMPAVQKPLLVNASHKLDLWLAACRSNGGFFRLQVSLDHVEQGPRRSTSTASPATTVGRKPMPMPI